MICINWWIIWLNFRSTLIDKNGYLEWTTQNDVQRFYLDSFEIFTDWQTKISSDWQKWISEMIDKEDIHCLMINVVKFEICYYWQIKIFCFIDIIDKNGYLEWLTKMVSTDWQCRLLQWINIIHIICIKYTDSHTCTS